VLSCRGPSRVLSAGHSVSATSIEIAIAAASTKPNSVNSRPTSPSRNEIGMNTAIRVSEVAITAKVTWRDPSTPAISGDSPSSIRRWMFSSTTIASSTTMPIARISASKVSTLIEKPSA
jgi:hypothetical protein